MSRILGRDQDARTAGIVFDDPLVGEPKDITVARGHRICRLPLSDAGVEAPTVADAAEVFRTTRSIRRDATAARRRKSACVARCSRSASRSSSRIRSKRSRARRRKRRVRTEPHLRSAPRARCVETKRDGLPCTEANQPPPIALSEAQVCALLAASYPLPAWAHPAFFEAYAREIANLPEPGDDVLHTIVRVQKLSSTPRSRCDDGALIYPVVKFFDPKEHPLTRPRKIIVLVPPSRGG